MNAGSVRPIAGRRVVAEPEPSIAELVSGILDDAWLLVRKELELARVELRGEVERARGAVAVLMLGASLLWFAAMALLTAAVLGLVAAGLQPWIAAVVLAVVLAVFGGLAARVGWRRLATVQPVPRRAVEALKGGVR